MLHATNSRKAKLRSFVLEGARTPFEDIVTSTVFGPLEFMNANDRRYFIDELARKYAFTLPDQYEPNFAFWRKRNSCAFRLRSVEPDLVVEIDKDSKIVIEVKWGAPLSRGELAAQWDSLSRKEQKKSHHLLIVRNAKQYRLDIERDRKALRKLYKTKWPLHQLRWRELANLFRDLSKRPTHPQNVRNWAALSASFLSREEFRILEDWSHIKLYPVEALEWRRATWPRLLQVKRIARLQFDA